MFFALGALGALCSAGGAAAVGTAAAVGAAAGGVAAAAGTAVAAGTAAASAVGGAAMAAGTTAAGAVGGAATVASGTLLSAGSVAMGTVSAAGSAAMAAGSTVVGAAGTAASTIGSAMGSALSTAAEMATVAATESSVMVGQIPIVGETLSSAAQAVGTMAGKATAKAASSMGLSTSTANTLGTIATGTTTNEINKQIMKPYNQIKDELTGVAEIKRNFKVLNDIAQGNLDLNDLEDLVERHQNELINMALEEVLETNFEDIEDLKEFKESIQNIYENYKQSKIDEETFEKLCYEILDEADIEIEEFENIRKIVSGDVNKDELEKALLEIMDVDAEDVEEKISLLKHIKEGSLDIDELTQFIQNNIDTPEFQEIKNNAKLMEAIEDERLDEESLSAVIASALGIKDILKLGEVKVTADNMDRIMDRRDCLLASWLTIPQQGEFFDLTLPKQPLPAEKLIKVCKFFPSVLLNKEGDTYYLDEMEIQNIGEPVVYAVVNFLAMAGVEYDMKLARRKIIITDLGEQHIKLLETYVDITDCDCEKGYEALSNLPCELPLAFTVDEATKVVHSFKALGCGFRIEKCGNVPEFQWDVYLTNAGKNEFGIVKVLKEMGYTLTEAIALIKESYNTNKLVMEDLVYDEAISMVNELKAQGAAALLIPSGKLPQPFVLLNEQAEELCSFLRKLPQVKEGDTLNFGKYWQSSEDYKEAIEWLLIKKLGNKDGREGIDGYYFISRKGLDCVAFDESSANWKHSDISLWLNGDFSQEAFTATELQAITIQQPEKDCFNKLFLMNYSEARQFFNAGDEWCAARTCQPTEYSKTCGSWHNEDINDPHYGNGWWWLRTPSNASGKPMSVNNAGGINSEGYHNVRDAESMVRPCFIIELPHIE